MAAQARPPRARRPFFRAAEAEAFLSAHPRVETIQALLVDIHGKARGKIIKRDALGSMVAKGVTIPNAPFSCDVWGKENLADRPRLRDWRQG